MAHWTDEFKDFKLSDDGREYSAIGKENNFVDVNASDVIKILENIACDENDGKNEIKVLRLEYCKIRGDLDIWDTDAEKVKRVKKCIKLPNIGIKLPNIELSFQCTVFDGNVDFSSARFVGEASFPSAQFKGKTSFSSARFGENTFFPSAQFKGKTSFSFAQFEGIR